jgi:hypothetical protein
MKQIGAKRLPLDLKILPRGREYPNRHSGIIVEPLFGV